MFAKVKSSVFINQLRLQLSDPKGEHIQGILKDDQGVICRTLEKKLLANKNELTWAGLNDLPYGRYTLELIQGENKMKLNLVKRV
ncbi:MAG: hypothetical protein R2796_03305 [Chitinophagaceae bacterium]|nr:hypothetical protein [Chitinophagaceae bacterium]HQU55934.1 hypothetical protein [Chitinophagaceae bacterium]HQV05146.1 hypothetical protein [Chitinophagaceae bacterium]